MVTCTREARRATEFLFREPRISAAHSSRTEWMRNCIFAPRRVIIRAGFPEASENRAEFREPRSKILPFVRGPSSLGANSRAGIFIPIPLITFAVNPSRLAGAGSSFRKIVRAMNLRNRERGVIQRAHAYARSPPGRFRARGSLLREARSKNRYAWIYRARRFRARHNVRVILDHFVQNGRYDPVLIAVRQTYRYSVRAVRRDGTPRAARELPYFETDVYVTLRRRYDIATIGGSLELSMRGISTCY